MVCELLAATKKSIRLRILKPLTIAVCVVSLMGYKKIDPFADTETFEHHAVKVRHLQLQKNRSVCGY